MFRIKICGVRLKSDVQAVAGAGGDAIGLNFYPKSVRYVDPNSPITTALSETALRLGLCRVGVFVNESDSAIRRVAKSVGLDAVQIHGDESVAMVRSMQLDGLPLIRAIKIPTDVPDAFRAISDAAEPWHELNCHLLFDADAGRAHGGSGKTIDWRALRAWAGEHPDARWTLAGGLRPQNVGEAIRVSGAESVDTASGVEEIKGQKSIAKIAAFIDACRNP